MINYYFKVLQNCATFNGRARRSEFWYFNLLNFIIVFYLGFVGGLIGTRIPPAIYSLLVLVPGIAVGVRRMHDVGKSGWFILIPIYNIVLAVQEGEASKNQYGLSPKS